MQPILLFLALVLVAAGPAATCPHCGKPIAPPGAPRAIEVLPDDGTEPDPLEPPRPRPPGPSRPRPEIGPGDRIALGPPEIVYIIDRRRFHQGRQRADGFWQISPGGWTRTTKRHPIRTGFSDTPVGRAVYAAMGDADIPAYVEPDRLPDIEVLISGRPR